MQYLLGAQQRLSHTQIPIKNMHFCCEYVVEQGRPSFLSVGAQTFNRLLRGTKFRITIWWCIMLALHTDTKESNYEHQQNHRNQCSCCPRDIVSNVITSYQIISNRQQGFAIPALYSLWSVTRLISACSAS